MSATNALNIANQLAQVYDDAVRQGNIEAVANLHTANARLLPPGEAIVNGRDAIQTYFQGLIDNGVKEMYSRTLDAQFLGDHTLQNIAQITVVLQLPDGQTQEFNTKAVVLWRREEDGEYRIDVDIWNQL